MKKNRPFTTLFTLISVDGKISTGDNDDLDVDKDFPKINGVKEGLFQYYDIEKHTDIVSLNTGRVMAKIGVNERTVEPTRMKVSFVIIDRKPHLTEKGVEYLCKWVNELYVVTTNKNHPAYKMKEKFPNLEIILYKDTIDLSDLLHKLKSQYKINRITVQSGGTLNAQWAREGLIDMVRVVVAPCLIGGENTQFLIGGESLHTSTELNKIKSLKLIECNILKNSYLDLKYKVLNSVTT
ncbi:MAG: dihydrofolate reductase family protein [Patescibacteria group bacterium]